MATLSLHERLCTLKEPRFSATDMIKDLIECLSITLTSSSVRRNTHTLCTAISRSRDLCNKINSLISASSNEDDWTSFDAYTVMVDPLERLLLELAELSENPCIGSLNGGLLISEWIEAGKLWVNNRRTTTKALASLFETEQSFKSTAAEVEAKDLTLFRQHDDNAFLDELAQEASSRANGQKNKFSPEGWKCLEATLPTLRAIRSKLQLGDKQDLTEYSVKFMLVFVGVVEVTVKTSDKVTRQHLGSHDVLSKVLAFSTLLEKHLDNAVDDPKLQSKRETQWRELIDALQKGRVASPSFNELKKFPAKIRPPYYLQCLVLVKYCRDLLKEHADKSPQPAVEPIQRAMASVTTALHAAAKLSEAAGSVKPNVDALKTTEVDNAFRTAVKVVGDSFKEYGIPFPRELIEQAKDTDESRYDAWKDKLRKAKGNSPASTVEVVVKLSGKAASSLKLKDETYKVSSTSSLNMILWHECQRSPVQYRERVRKARFEVLEQPGKALSLSDSISVVLGTATTTKARSVQLIVD